MPRVKCTFTPSPCHQAEGCIQDPGTSGGGHLCQQPSLGCPRAVHGAHPWCCPSIKHQHRLCLGGRLCPSHVLHWHGMAWRVGTPLAWGSRRSDVGAWQGPHSPEASLCAEPTSGTWHSGRARGSEAETKQPSPWQCPPAWDKCPQLGGEDRHKELLDSTRGTARATFPRPRLGHVPQAGRRHSRRGCLQCGHKATQQLVPQISSSQLRDCAVPNAMPLL